MSQKNKVMTKRDVRFFKLAREMASMSDYPRIHIGCVVVYGYKILSTGFNTTKTHPLQKQYNLYRVFEPDSKAKYTVFPSLHAEINALYHIKDLDINWHKVEVYTYYKGSKGYRGNSRPCAGCMAFMKDLGIRYIHYSTIDGYADECISKEV